MFSGEDQRLLSLTGWAVGGAPVALGRRQRPLLRLPQPSGSGGAYWLPLSVGGDRRQLPSRQRPHGSSGVAVLKASGDCSTGWFPVDSGLRPRRLLWRLPLHQKGTLNSGVEIHWPWPVVTSCCCRQVCCCFCLVERAGCCQSCRWLVSHGDSCSSSWGSGLVVSLDLIAGVDLIASNSYYCCRY